MHSNYILEYWNEIKNGNIIVSEKIRKTYEKLANDVIEPQTIKVINEETFEEENKTFHFDIEKATRPILFIEKFCKPSKGKGAGKNVKLMLWQKAFIQAVFGFVDDEGFRRYREVLLIIARKNGKSSLASWLGLYMMLKDNEPGADIYCLASKKDQAKLVFNEAVNVVIQSGILGKKVTKRKSDLYYAKTLSTFQPLASDSNSLDGLNPHGGIIDELHCLKDRNLYDVVKQAMTARQQPILFEITTAGFVRESIYDAQYNYASGVIDGTKEDNRFISFIYELDNRDEYKDKTKWIKSNPGLGVIKSVQSLNESFEKANQDITYLPTLMTKDFNMRETGVKSWLDFDLINVNYNVTLEDLRDSYVIGGVDLSSATSDLTCASILGIKYMEKDGELKPHLLIYQKYFIPADGIQKKIDEDKIPYDVWDRQGYIEKCDGTKVDYSKITEWFVSLVKDYQIIPYWIGYDPWNSGYWIDEMEKEGFTLVKVRQGAITMSAPIKELTTEFKAGTILFNIPILKWCLVNTSLEYDKNDNVRPVKGRGRTQRIDGAMALINSFVVYLENKNDFLNLTK